MFTKKITLVLFVFVALFIFNGTLFAQEKAFPKKGEGITLFLKRHNRVGKEYHDEFVKLNKTKPVSYTHLARKPSVSVKEKVASVNVPFRSYCVIFEMAGNNSLIVSGRLL